MKKWGDHLENKFIIDNIVQALIWFKKFNSCLFFGPSKEGKKILMKKKCGGNMMVKLQSEMWGSTF